MNVEPFEFVSVKPLTVLLSSTAVATVMHM